MQNFRLITGHIAAGNYDSSQNIFITHELLCLGSFLVPMDSAERNPFHFVTIRHHMAVQKMAHVLPDLLNEKLNTSTDFAPQVRKNSKVYRFNVYLP